MRLLKTGADLYRLDFFDLGDCRSLDSLVFHYRETIDAVNSGRWPSTREEAEFRTVARALYERLWAPVMDRDAGMRHAETPDDSETMVFIVPYSWLCLVDFNTLLAPGRPHDRDGPLADRRYLDA